MADLEIDRTCRCDLSIDSLVERLEAIVASKIFSTVPTQAFGDVKHTVFPLDQYFEDQSLEIRDYQKTFRCDTCNHIDLCFVFVRPAIGNISGQT